MANLCPPIASSEHDVIVLSTYTRAVGTFVVIGCRGFGQHVKDPTSVVCQADTTWSEEPNLDCSVDLDEKERIYVAVAVVCVALFMFGCCWITAATICCRDGRRRYSGRSWFGDRWFGDRWFGGRYSDERIVNRKDRYADTETMSKRWDAFYKKDKQDNTPDNEDDLEDNWFNKHKYSRKGRSDEDNSDAAKPKPTRTEQRSQISSDDDAQNIPSLTMASVHVRLPENLGRSQSLEDLAYSRSHDQYSRSRDLSRPTRPAGNQGYTAPFDFYDYKHSYEGYSVDPESRSTNIAARYYDIGATLSNDGSTSSRPERLHVTSLQDRTRRPQGPIALDAGPFALDAGPFALDADPFSLDTDSFALDADQFAIDEDPFALVTDDDYGSLDRKDYRDEIDERKDRSVRKSFRDDNLALSRKSGFRDDKSFRDDRDDKLALSRKSRLFDDNWRSDKPRNGNRRRRWSYDDVGHVPLNYLGIHPRAWNRTRVSTRPGESWRYGYLSDREMLRGGRKDDYGFDGRDDFRRNLDDRGKVMLRGGREYDYGFDDRDGFRRKRFDGNGQPIFPWYEDSDALNRYPRNDMENIYRLRRKYDRVFDYEHPRIPEYNLPRDQEKFDRVGYGRAWDVNYPVLRPALHETIYSIHGDPEFSRRRRLSDPLLDRQRYQGYQSEMIKGGGEMYGTGFGQYDGGYAGTRKYAETLRTTQPYRQIEYRTDYEPSQLKMGKSEKARVANEALQSSPGYEVITLPTSHQIINERTAYQSTDNGPRVMQLDAQKLLPSFRKSGSYVMQDAHDDTDYFRGRRDFTIGARRSQKELDQIFYHGLGKTTEIYEENSEFGRKPLIVTT